MAAANNEDNNTIKAATTLSVPFTVSVLKQHHVANLNTIQATAAGADHDADEANYDRSMELLPATHRIRRSEDPPGNDIELPRDKLKFLRHELLVNRLNDAHGWLWVCGRPMPPRPLHHQLLLKREIAVTEDPELHLVWSRGRIFLKPLPEWLLDPAFWAAHITGSSSSSEDQRALAGCARGFLFTYCALIAYRSDFRIAVDRGLLPQEVTWKGWKTLSAQVLDSHSYAAVNPRYWYGELRLDRLNKVFTFRFGRLLRGYSSVDSAAVYMDLLRDNFGILAALLVYVVVVLTAMQVGLSVDRLKDSDAFQSASYGFTVFSIVSPLGGAAVILVLFLPMFCGNWIETKRYEARRFEKMGVDRIQKKEESGGSDLA